MELPVTFKERMKQQLGEEEFKQYEESFHAKRMYGLRVNTRKVSVEEFKRISPFALEPIPWISNGFFYDGDQVSPAKHPYYHAGLYYLQEPSAMTPANVLPVEPGDRVLDLCAAPGGKATELGVKLKGEGVLAANDISSSRAKGLLKNLELFGIPNLMVINETPQKLLSFFPGYFNKILIDAPCSGEGMFRKDPAIMKSWQKKGPEEFSVIQREIASAAVQMLAPFGMLLYSTCTFSPEENEGTILFLLKEFEELEVCTINGYEGFSPGRPEWLSFDCAGYEEQLRRCVRIWPHKMNGEGHFLALLRKKGQCSMEKEEPIKKAYGFKNEEFEQFLSIIDRELDDDRFVMYQDRVYYLPCSKKHPGQIHFLRNGLLLGECKKNRFEPSQALAMFLKKDWCRQTISLKREDVRVVKYLKGETLEIEAQDVEMSQEWNGSGKKGTSWYLVCVDGYPLGWGKLTNGILKNKYHAGWRWM